MQSFKRLATLGLPFCLATTLLIADPAFAQTVNAVAGTGVLGFSGDNGPAAGAQLNLPIGVLVRRDGSILIADASNHRVRKIDAAGVITTFAGTGVSGFAFSAASAALANLNRPSGLAEDQAGNVYVGNKGSIQKISPSGALSTIAGDGSIGNVAPILNGVPASTPGVFVEWALAIRLDTAGNLFFVDYAAHVLRKIDSTNIITTLAGTGVAGYSGENNLATNSQIDTPGGLLVNSDGSILVSSPGTNRIQKFTPGGILTTIAGTGSGSSTGDGGLATLAAISLPYGLEKDAAGNIYIAEFFGNRVRKIAPDGIITTLLGSATAPAGTASAATNTGDGGDAVSATINNPVGLSRDAANNLYVSSFSGDKLRKITFPVIVSGPSVFRSFVNTTTANLGTIFPEGEQTVAYGSTLNVSVTAKPRHVLKVASNCDYFKTSMPVPFVPIGTGLDTYNVTVNGSCEMEATFFPLVPRVNVNSEAAADSLFKVTERSQAYIVPATTPQTFSVVNAPVIFKAWVTDIAGVPYPSPSNVITFKANGAAIAGCANVPLTLRASNVIHIREATCETTFALAGNATLTAEFAGDTYNFPAVSSMLNHGVTAK